MTDAILVATDLSERSDRALHRAATIARATGARLLAAHVVDDAMPEDMRDTMLSRAEKGLHKQLGHLADGLDFEAKVVTGDPTGALLRLVAETQPRLLVVGTHRPRPFLDLVRETTVMRIVRRAACPVLMVRIPGDTPYATVLSACDFSPASDAALLLSAQLAPDATRHPVHAVHVPYSGMMAASGGSADLVVASFLQEAEQQAEIWRKKKVVQSEELKVVHGPLGAVIWQEANRLNADLICAGAHGRVGAPPALLGSLATELLRDAPCDVLLARPAADQ
ncbi:universal stress protein [Thetidibacter halocola]|uniref:Universal stress protein n=1 Tax=Thetidibacter halocola TaxID=2827239 RepID=A0A8J7W8J9_9RHOB|nr:universal stress protein [Thetidibacter halocola]MBS0122870.1 universal stress protein [Thetidibacter halocola]